MRHAYMFLIAAIGAEIIGTTFLQKTQQFTKLWPSLAMALAFAVSFYLLSHALKTIPLGIAYAIWSGLGMVIVAGISRFYFGHQLDTASLIGIAMIIGGVLVINLFSNSATH
ncbi:MAG: multidrug efflux SMR transporter [Paracoccus sp. (in: a-proteobacteria)]|nr:multidrug efflux SMR transporter [Paracoccus sp. (in: a-proteobacteria)]